MITLDTDKKYTLILSAYQATNTDLQNMLDTERMYDALTHRYHVHAIRAIGVYNGDQEQSFVIHTNSANTMAEVRRLALNAYNQECILVRHNRKHEIKLHNFNCDNTLIGTRFELSDSKHAGQNFTVLNGKDYYVVK